MSLPSHIVGKITTSTAAVVQISKIGAELGMWDAGGNLVWRATLGTDRVHAIALGAHGQNSVLATGSAGDDAFLRKYSNDGTVLWTRAVRYAASPRLPSPHMKPSGGHERTAHLHWKSV